MEDLRATRTALWGRGFRPFFLLAAGYGALFPLLWAAVLGGWLRAPDWLWPTVWHGHEMVFGFTAAAIAGFLLTAVPVWTGTKPLTGGRLAALAALWLAGRLVVLDADALPPGWVAVVDVAFLPALALALARPLVGQRRNAGFLLVLLALAAANGLFHANAIGRPAVTASTALRCAVDLIAVLLVVIGGRITPAFTRNALARAGAAGAVRPSPNLDRLALAGTAIAAGAGLFAQTEALRGAAALVAGLAVAARLLGWRPWRILDTPLLWSLHAGQAWLAIGLVATGIAALGGPVTPTLALHALTAGAIGATVLAVTTRVALGHTGRPLEPPRGTALAYGLVNAAALVRVAGPAALPGRVLAVWITAGLLWAAAYALYLVLYAPMLLSPRVDGKPG